MHAEQGIKFKNVGWTLGEFCPMRCRHCYSRPVRQENKSGKWLDEGTVESILDQLVGIGVQTVNLGGNEPIFTFPAG